MSIVTLTHSPAKIVQYLLIQLELGVVPPSSGTPGPSTDWPVYAHQKIINANPQVSYPINAIIVYDTGGDLNGRVMLTGIETEQYGIMIHTRHLDPEVAQQYAGEIKDTLLQSVYRIEVPVPAEVNAGGTTTPEASYFIQALTQKSSVIQLGTETQNRWCTSSVNFTINTWEVD